MEEKSEAERQALDAQSKGQAEARRVSDEAWARADQAYKEAKKQADIVHKEAKKIAVDIHGNRVEPVEHGKRGRPTADEQFENMTSPPEPRMLNEIKDCNFCPGVFCVHRSIRFKDYFCQRCGTLQSTGKNLKELLLFT